MRGDPRASGKPLRGSSSKSLSCDELTEGVYSTKGYTDLLGATSLGRTDGVTCISLYGDLPGPGAQAFSHWVRVGNWTSLPSHGEEVSLFKYGSHL